MSDKAQERVEIDLGWAKVYIPADYDMGKLPDLAEFIEVVRQAKLKQLTGQKIKASAKLEVKGE